MQPFQLMKFAVGGYCSAEIVTIVQVIQFSLLLQFVGVGKREIIYCVYERNWVGVFDGDT